MSLPTGVQRGLFDLIYSTWLHNSQAIALFLGCVFTLGLQLLKPKRTTLLFFLGFLLLLLEFEYIKHIAAPLASQTLQAAVVNPNQNLRFQRYLSQGIGKLISILLYLGGWGAIFVGIFFSTFSEKKKK